MKVIFDYNETTGEIRDKNGMSICMIGMIPFDPEKEQAPVLELIKQGVSPDEIIKLRNNDLL